MRCRAVGAVGTVSNRWSRWSWGRRWPASSRWRRRATVARAAAVATSPPGLRPPARRRAWSRGAGARRPPRWPSRPNELNGVSCPAGGTCVAVGYYDNGQKDQTLIETFSAGSWHIVRSPDQGPSTNVLNSVSCTDRRFLRGRGLLLHREPRTGLWSRRCPPAPGTSRPAPTRAPAPTFSTAFPVPPLPAAPGRRFLRGRGLLLQRQQGPGP